MAARNAGSAFVKIRPDATDFVRDLRRDLVAAKDPGFVVNVSANTAQAAADVRRFREVQGRDGMKLGVDVALGQADADMKAFRARQRADGLVVKVDADTGKAQTELASLRRQLGSFGSGRGALRINIAASGLTMIPIAVNGLAQLAGALQQVAQAGLAVPGGIAAATASIGTLAFGLSGVSDAWDAISAAADSAGTDSASSARAAAAASNQLRNAIVDEAQARKDVAQATRDARQELQDLNVEMQGGLISESRAILQAQQARERYAKGDFTDQRDALLDIAEADQRVLEVRSRNTQRAEELRDVNAKGVAGSDQVVAANERLVRSHQQVTEAQQAAAEAGGSSAAQQKADAAMAKLSPNARDFLNTLKGLKPVVGDLKNSVQDIQFDGLADRLESTVQTLLPTLSDGLGGIARGWNANFQQLFTSIGSENGRGILDRILGNTGDAQQRFTAAIDPLIVGVGTLAAAGTDAMPRVADAIGSVADRFSRFITQADQDGRLAKWIDEGLTGLGHLGETVLNLGKVWTAITKAAGGGALLEDLEKITTQLQLFLNSTEGQEKLRKFFDEGREMFNRWRPILEDIPGLFQGIYDGAKTYIGGVMTIIGPLVELLSNFPALTATAVAAFAGFKTISGVAALLGSLKLVSDKLSIGLPNAAAKGTKGINSSLSKIAIPAALAGVLVNETGDMIGGDQSAGTNLKGLAANTGGMALSGAMVAGAPGAIVGAIAGLGTSIYQRILSDIEEGRVEWESKWEADRAAGPDRPGSPSVANEVTGRTGVLQPSIYNPDGTMKPTASDDLRQKIAAGQMPGYSINPQGQVVGPNGQVVPLPGFKQGGATPSGRGAGPTGGHVVEVHSDEWVLPTHARRAVGDKNLAALTAGRSFEGGGLVDEYGNPVNPGAQPGPLNDSLPIAPNPTAGAGGVSGILSQVVSGLQGPIGNALAIGQQIGGMAQSAGASAPAAAGGPTGTTHGLGTTAPGPITTPGAGASFASRAASLPGLAGLFGSMAIQDPASQTAALTQWGGQTAQWLGNWGMGTATKIGSALYQGALGAVGLENSILSSTNPWNQAASSAGQFFMNADGPLGTLMGAGGAGSGVGGVTDPAALAAKYGVTIDPQILAAISGGGTTGLTPGSELPAGVGPEGGLQVNTIKAKRAISAAFPQITEIGGVRKDALKWHPNGLAIDVMIPGQGGNNDPTTPEGLALGNQIYAYVMAHKDELGVDYVMWQEKDHYNHLHVNTTGGGYPGKDAQFAVPGMAAGGPTPSAPGPVDAKGGHLAVVHPKEFMISARGRATVPDSFLHALNKGMVDPKDLPGYYPGGPIAAAGVRPLPLPPPPPVQARLMNPPVAPARPTGPAPAAAKPVAPAAPSQPAPAVPTSPQAPTGDPGAPVGAPTTTGGAQIAAAPSSTNHNLDAVNTLISSSASNLGQLASTALSIAAMGAGASGVPGAGAIGAIGPFVAGGIQQGGKVVEGLVNVVSSSLVGNVPGSFGGEPGASPYGRTVRPAQDAPITSPVRNTTYNVSGNYELRRAMEQLELRESISAQADLANHK